MTQRVLVDAHVHLHGCFDAAVFLDAAAANFRRAAQRTGVAAGAPGFLLLAETPDARAFERLRDGTLDVGTGWEIRAGTEAESVLACRDGSPRLIIVAGTQIQTADGLEVLALLSRHRFAARLPLASTVAEVQRVGAIPVVPWGFGKWTLRRAEPWPLPWSPRPGRSSSETMAGGRVWARRRRCCGAQVESVSPCCPGPTRCRSPVSRTGPAASASSQSWTRRTLSRLAHSANGCWR
jgi:hypothetical protein